MCVNRCVNELKRDGAKKRREKAMRHVMMIIGLCLRIDHSIQIYQDIGEDWTIYEALNPSDIMSET